MNNTFNIKNLNRKILSLVIGIFLWSFIMGIENPEIKREFRNIEVEIEGATNLKKHNLHLSEPVDPKINLEVRGVRSNVNKINRSDITATIDIGSLEEGSITVPVDVSINSSVGRVYLENVEPKTMDIKLESILTETYEIEVDVLGELAEGYSLGEIRPVNKYVRITGPESTLEKIAKVVAPVELGSDKQDSFVEESNLLVIDDAGVDVEGITTNVTAVKVEVPIYSLKSVPIEPVITGDTENKLINISTDPESVLIKGYKEALEDINVITTEPVEYNSLIGHESYPLTLKLPEGIRLYNSDQKHTMTYQIRSDEDMSALYTIDDIEIKNTPPDLEVQITGADQLDLDPIDGDSKPEISIDLSEITEPGKYNIPLDYQGELFDNNNIINIEVTVENTEDTQED